jgi:hypothetical protein
MTYGKVDRFCPGGDSSFGIGFGLAVSAYARAKQAWTNPAVVTQAVTQEMAKANRMQVQDTPIGIG